MEGKRHVPPGPSRARATRCGGEEGVSPVVGMILILAVSVLGVVAVTNWGLPAVTEMKTNLEMRQVLDEFADLDATLQQLVAGTAGQTTFKWQPTISQGAIDVNSTANRWLVTADAASWLKITYGSISDEDNAFVINSNASLYNLKMQAWTWSSGAPTELWINTSTPCGGAVPNPMVTFPATLFLHHNGTCTPVSLRNVVLTLSINASSTLVGSPSIAHRAFLLDVGHIHWSSIHGSRGPSHVFATNGGVIGGAAGRLVVQNDVGVAPPRNFTNSTGAASTSLFARFTKLEGNASFSGVGGGAERHAVFLNLVGTYTLGTADNITQAMVYVWGDHRAPVYKDLTDAVKGYRFVEETDAAVGETYVKHREGTVPFRFSAIYSLVKAEA